MIALQEDMVTLAEAAKRYPGALNTQKLHRWRQAGVLDAAGQRVLLECVKLGGLWFVSLGALWRFLQATNRQVRTEGNSPRRRRGRLIVSRRHDRAMAELEADEWTPIHNRRPDLPAAAGGPVG